MTEHDAAGPEEQGLPDFAAPDKELTGIEPAAVAPDTVLPGAFHGDSDIPVTEASAPLWQFPEGVPSADSDVAHGVSPEEGVIGKLVDPDGALNADRAFQPAVHPRAIDARGPDDVGDEVGGQGLLGDDLADDGVQGNALAASSLVSEELREHDESVARRAGNVVDEVAAGSALGENVAPKAGMLIGGEPPITNLDRPGLPYDPVDPVKGWQDRETDAEKDAEIEAQIEAALAEPPTPIEVVRDPLASLDTGRSVALPGLIGVAIAAIALAFFLNLRGVGNPAEHGVPQETETVATQPATPGNTGPTDTLTTLMPREAVTVTGGPGRTIVMDAETGEIVTEVSPGQTIIYDPDTGTITDLTN